MHSEKIDSPFTKLSKIEMKIFLHCFTIFYLMNPFSNVFQLPPFLKLLYPVSPIFKLFTLPPNPHTPQPYYFKIPATGHMEKHILGGGGRHIQSVTHTSKILPSNWVH